MMAWVDMGDVSEMKGVSREESSSGVVGRGLLDIRWF
jgi:hypothetical protein